MSNDARERFHKEQRQSARFNRRNVLLTGTSILTAAGLQPARAMTAEQAQQPAAGELFCLRDRRHMTALRYDSRRISRDHCCGTIIDVQGYFLSQVDNRPRAKL